MKLREWQISVSMVCAVLGALLAIQIRTQSAVHSVVRTRRVEDLALMVTNLEEEKEALISENGELKKKLEDAARGRNLFKSVTGEMENLKVKAGLVEVEGPGVTVKLEDSTIKPKQGEDPNLFLVHEDDLLKLSNELFAAGAEAVAINEQRLIATSEVKCAGPTISINNTRIGSPYIIKAIGEAKTLETSLLMRGYTVETLKSWGIRVSIARADIIRIPAYKGAIANVHALPVKGDE